MRLPANFCYTVGFECKLNPVNCGAPSKWVRVFQPKELSQCCCDTEERGVETLAEPRLAKPEYQVKPSNTAAIQQDNWSGRNLWFLENELTDLDQSK